MAAATFGVGTPMADSSRTCLQWAKIDGLGKRAWAGSPKQLQGSCRATPLSSDPLPLPPVAEVARGAGGSSHQILLDSV